MCLHSQGYSPQCESSITLSENSHSYHQRIGVGAIWPNSCSIAPSGGQFLHQTGVCHHRHPPSRFVIAGWTLHPLPPKRKILQLGFRQRKPKKGSLYHSATIKTPMDYRRIPELVLFPYAINNYVLMTFRMWMVCHMPMSNHWMLSDRSDVYGCVAGATYYTFYCTRIRL